MEAEGGEMKLRIVTDNYAGYEVQEKKWFWPFWRQCNFTNTHSSIENAEEWAKNYSKKVIKEWKV